MAETTHHGKSEELGVGFVAQPVEQRLRLPADESPRLRLGVSAMMRRSVCLSNCKGPRQADSPPPGNTRELRMPRMRIEGKGTAAFRWPGEAAALADLAGVEGFARVVEGLLRAAR